MGVALASAVLAALAALRCARAHLLLGVVVLGCGASGVILSTGAWRAAWRSSLRVAFESMARNERQEGGRRPSALPGEARASVVLVGVLLEDAGPRVGGGATLRVGVRWMGRLGGSRGDRATNPVEGGVALSVAGEAAHAHLGEWRRGRTIRASADLGRPARYLDPGVPDQERALARRGISLVGTVKSAALVEVVGGGTRSEEAAAAARAFVRRAVAATVGSWSVRSSGIVTAILIGDRTGLEADVERRLQQAGTYHVIAISGGNIALLAGLVVGVFRLAGMLGRGAMLGAAVGVLAYGYLVGGGASVDRATLMAAVFFVGRSLDLRGAPLNALSLVGGALVVANPLVVTDPGFLLTFGATTSILFVLSARPFGGVPRVLAPLALMGIASLAAEAALMPVGAALFSRVTIAGVVLNFVAIPLMAVAQVAGMGAAATFVAIPPLAWAAGWVAHVAADGLVRTADIVAVVPVLTWRVAPPSPVVLALYYFSASVGAVLWWHRSTTSGSDERRAARLCRRSAVGLALSAGIWIVCEPWTLLHARGDGRLHVTFIDVGQGDSTFVRFPRGSTLLVDAGGLPGSATFDIGERVVGPVLRAFGTRRLGTLVITHGDADHVGGARSTIEEFRPWDVWEGIPVQRTALLQALKTAASGVGSRWTSVHRDDEVVIDGVRVRIRHPARADWDRQKVRNDDSVVIELLWRDVSVVLAGDIGRDVEQELVARFEASPIRVLKVPHHGSLTSSSEAFVSGLGPRVAVISAGRGNAFGHPAPDVLRRLHDAGAVIFRTDRDGAVTIDTDGTSLQGQTFAGKRFSVPAKPQEVGGSTGRASGPDALRHQSRSNVAASHSSLSSRAWPNGDRPL